MNLKTGSEQRTADEHLYVAELVNLLLAACVCACACACSRAHVYFLSKYNDVSWFWQLGLGNRTVWLGLEKN